ncbi:MAG TPA: menaquinone biosynthesis decarboxylase [Armatimonadota bacterium]|nr:menaquinone biosynthesis decarboxylase [Armatimonadota bacterium]
MAYKDLREFVARLESAGELKRIRMPFSPELEITEVADRAMKCGGPALLIEQPTGFDIPVLINAFGSKRRMAMALGVEDIDEAARRIEELVKMEVPEGFIGKLKMLPSLVKLSASFPKSVKSGICQEVILRGDEASLDRFPILKCWPGDGGRFITLPVVFTKDPETGTRNVGMYRMHVYDGQTTGMHWHAHKVGARHYTGYERMGRRMEVAVALGGDPAITYSATAPLPEDIDEMIFAGFLRQKPVEMVKCVSIDLEVPADSEIVIEGYVEPGERRMEGPFGDHTGYYSLADEYPVFHVTAITHRKDPIYPATIVGKPPMEDCWLAKATERIFLPLIKTQIPELVDMNLPVEGVFHNLAVVSIRKRYPGHARKVMHALWGMGQMSFTKIIIVVDEHVNVQDMHEVLWRLGNNIDPERDVCFVQGPVDVLNHASPVANFGSKMGIDATKKLPEEGMPREWPPDIEMHPAVKAKIDGLWKELGIG